MTDQLAPPMAYPVYRFNIHNGTSFLETARTLGEGALAGYAETALAQMAADYPEHAATYTDELALRQGGGDELFINQ
jgi:hypothetical protein